MNGQAKKRGKRVGGQATQVLSYSADGDRSGFDDSPVLVVAVSAAKTSNRSRPAWVTHQLRSQTIRSQVQAFRSAVDIAIAEASTTPKILVDG